MLDFFLCSNTNQTLYPTELLRNKKSQHSLKASKLLYYAAEFCARKTEIIGQKLAHNLHKPLFRSKSARDKNVFSKKLKNMSTLKLTLD